VLDVLCQGLDSKGVVKLSIKALMPPPPPPPPASSESHQKKTAAASPSHHGQATEKSSEKAQHVAKTATKDSATVAIESTHPNREGNQ
jgi:hypothetical protein